jgi:hypothetical protein
LALLGGRCLARVARVLVASALGLCAVGAGSAPGEYQVKGAFLYNFAKFVEWPAPALAGRDAFVICVLGSGQEARELSAVIEGKSVRGKPVVVQAPGAADDAGACHILFVAGSRELSAEDVARAVGRAHVLTVGESERFARDGGMVNFVNEERKLRFEINKRRAEDAGLAISSHLLKLAQSVYE